jgi:hypothetical protein
VGWSEYGTYQSGAKTLNIQNWLGAIAGMLSLAGFIPYWWAIWQHKTCPNRATWWIWTMVGVMIAISYRAIGADSTMWVPISYVIGPLGTAVLSIKFGEGGWTKLDRTCLLGVGIGLILWGVARSPDLTLGMNIGIDFLGALPTIRKSIHDPYSEDQFSWLLFALSSIVNLLAIDQWGWSIAIYPIYILLITSVIWGCLQWGRLRVQKQRRKIYLD